MYTDIHFNTSSPDISTVKKIENLLMNLFIKFGQIAIQRAVEYNRCYFAKKNIMPQLR